ncbi:hypothetical protein [Mucilaginibacter sp.]|uniref:hypothetical protein n=1 Tax=Mucilaginibacter sp. TaxID=1882438 RepID=UPI003265FA25
MSSTTNYKIETNSALENLVNLDLENHKLKDIAVLFLKAMNDWPTPNQYIIADFVTEFKGYFGSPLSIKKIDSKGFDGQNAWQLEAGGSITEAIDISSKFCNENDFDNILKNILDFYEQEFKRLAVTPKVTAS